MPVKDASMAHQVSLTDDEYKLVFSRYTSDRRHATACASPARPN
jgi:D-amino-acid dehydrogenase